MPTPILTVQSNTPSPTPAAKAPPGAADNFQRTLTQQMEKRQNAPRHEGQQARAAAPKPQSGAKPVPPAAAPAAKVGSTTADKASDKTGPADAAAPTEKTASEPAPDTSSAGDAQAAALAEASSDAQAALAGPVTDMLALVASFNQSVAQRAIGAASQGDAEAGSQDDAVVPDAASGTLAAGFGLAGAASASIGNTPFSALSDSRPAPVTTGPARQVAAGLERSEPVSAKPDLTQLAAQEPATPLARQGAADAAALSTRERAIPAASESVPNALAMAAPLQQASLQIAQVASAVPSDKLNGRVGTPGWDQQLGQKIVWMVAGGEQSASLTLNPPDLGPLQVVLSVSNDHADATFTASQPEVRQALEAALPRLREMMSEAGIELGQATVSAGMSNRQDGTGGEAGRGFAGARGHAAAADSAGLPSAASAVRAALPGMVDTFA
jgi:flagellar hook-length control protein FliK